MVGAKWTQLPVNVQPDGDLAGGPVERGGVLSAHFCLVEGGGHIFVW